MRKAIYEFTLMKELRLHVLFQFNRERYQMELPFAIL